MRIDPALPVHMVKTYAIDAPLASHWRKATCAEVECAAFENGWITTVSENLGMPAPFPEELAITEAEHFIRLETLKDRDQQRAYYIRRLSGRKFTESFDAATGFTVFDFEAGQPCFAPHRVRVDRPEIFRVVGGDHRGNPRGETRVHVNATDWVEDFQEHQDTIDTRIKRG